MSKLKDKAGILLINLLSFAGSGEECPTCFWPVSIRHSGTIFSNKPSKYLSLSAGIIVLLRFILTNLSFFSCNFNGYVKMVFLWILCLNDKCMIASSLD
jgi:hypothetical protein